MIPFDSMSPEYDCFSGGGNGVGDDPIGDKRDRERGKLRPRESSISCEGDKNAGKKKSTPRLRLGRRERDGASGETDAPKSVLMTVRPARRTTSMVDRPV